MATTDKLKKSTSSGVLTVRIPDQQLKLAKSVVAQTVRDLCDSDPQVVWDAAFFFTQDQHVMWCKAIKINEDAIKEAVSCILRETGARRKRMTNDLVARLKSNQEETNNA